MQVARTSSSAESWPLFRWPNSAWNPLEMRFGLNDQRALQSASDRWRVSRTLNPEGQNLIVVRPVERTLQDGIEPQQPSPVEYKDDVQGVVAHFFPTVGFTAIGDWQDEIDSIDTIPAPYEDRYGLRQPIPVTFEDVAEDDAVIARFQEAELAITGSDRQDAKASLAHWILDLFDDLVAANPQALGRTPALQIRVLNEYISRRT